MEVNQIKDAVQKKARQAWEDGGEWGLLALATRVGKSKIAIDVIKDLLKVKPTANILLVVPTIKLRDNNWETEFIQWDQKEDYDQLWRRCYASIKNLTNCYFDLVIFDEGHNLTDGNSKFFETNTVLRVMALSATPPNPKGNETDEGKALLFQQLRLKTDFEYPIDQAVAEGVITPYEIRVIETNLDDSSKYIKAGSAKKGYFMITEKKAYEYANKVLIQSQFAKWAMLKRMRLVYGSIAKSQIAKTLIQRAEEQNQRTIVFCGGIDQAETLGPGKTFHSKTKGDQLDAFIAQKLDMLFVVEAMNEGITVPNVDREIIIQLTSNPKDFRQRIGRSLGLRPGHIAVIYVIVCIDTQDKAWLEKAIEGLDKSVISYIHAKNL